MTKADIRAGIFNAIMSVQAYSPEAADLAIAAFYRETAQAMTDAPWRPRRTRPRNATQPDLFDAP